ncbi:MAG: Signal transduction histidine-protein kinase BarA [Chlamydiae bacterium]|nr:Signal transduction histidine-protein kinase BarA [Chlamydiota bacterium]
MCNQKFKTKFAIVGKVKQNKYEILHAISPNPELATGKIFDLSNTYCTHVIKAKAPIGFKQISEAQFDTRPYYKHTGLEAFIGAPIYVDGDIYGTISFSNDVPHEKHFSKKNFTLIQIIANWIGIEISRARSQEYLKIQKDKADKANQTKSEFLTNMTHEILTPMNRIIGLANLLVETDLDDKQQVFANGIVESADYLLHAVNDILDISKIEAGKIEIEFSHFNLKNLVEQISSTTQLKARDKKIEVHLRYAKNIPQTIISDSARIRQILENLTNNAVKFTPEGHVTIEVERPKSDIIKFSITDNGIGIPEDKHNLIFNKFNQVDTSTSRKFGGTGLGLAICKELSHLLGGEIGVESTPGNGATFWFTIKPQSPISSPYMAPDKEKIEDAVED